MMRVKRTAILASMLVSMLTSIGFGFSAFTDGDSPDVVFAGEHAGPQVPSAPAANDPDLQNDVQTRSGGLKGYFLWAGALVSFVVLLVSTILFRVEVSAEKAAGRARAERREYHRDLRRYKEQMQGPSQDNT